MNRTPFTIRHKLNLLTDWYGTAFDFKRDTVDKYKEPTGALAVVQQIHGIYHASEKSFIELINTEGAAIKGGSKVGKGILCGYSNTNLSVQQGDKVSVAGVPNLVTAVEPIVYGDVPVAWEISLEEVVQGVN